VIVSIPARGPTAFGENVTLIVQVPFAARVAGFMGQLFVSAKSPEAAIELMVRALVPVFVNVTVWASLVVVSNWPPNLRLEGERPTPGAAAAPPVPVKLTLSDCELDNPPSVIVRVMAKVAASGEAAEGVNVRLMVHDAPAPMLAPHVLDGEAKSAALLPLKARAPTANGIGSEVLFVNVTVCGLEVTPTACAPKSILDGKTVRVGISVNLATKAADTAPAGKPV